jgi:hypothetical protein
MGNRQSGIAGALPVQALYSLAKLARFANVTRHVLRRVLRSNGVVFVHGGRSLFVPLSEIRRKIPPLWESICLAEEVRRGKRPTRSEAGGYRSPGATPTVRNQG